jgi:hypothetical protein
MEHDLFTVEPGAGSGETHSHEGEEFIVLLTGESVVWVDRVERYTLISAVHDPTNASIPAVRQRCSLA